MSLRCRTCRGSSTPNQSFYAALLVPAGRAADRFGLKGTFVVGLLTFTLASLGAAVSGALWALILFRCLQAAGAAILTPSSLGLVLATAPLARCASTSRPGPSAAPSRGLSA